MKFGGEKHPQNFDAHLNRETVLTFVLDAL